jgi:LCP family protein required for cell wall assembly
MFTMLLVPTLVLGGWVLYLNHQVAQIPRFEVDLDRPGRPARPAGEALTFLVVGVDTAQAGGSFQNTMRQETWPVGSFRGDVIMLVHLDADRSAGQVMSIPRDSWVPIPGHGTAKINAAFSYGGPLLTQRTVEKLTNVRIDHLAMIDWSSFKDLTTALGGVQVTIPETFTDTHNNVTWREGTYNLEGAKALQYVRTRYGLTNGDFDRIQRQQNFLRAMLHKMLSQGTVSNPIKLTNVLQVLTDNLTVDEDFSAGEMRDLALSLRGLHGDDVEYLTAPLGRYDTVNGASVVRLQKKESDALFSAVRTDDIEAYLHKYGGDTLPDADKVN